MRQTDTGNLKKGAVLLKTVCVCLFVAVFCALLPAAEAEKSESEFQKRLDTLQYGLESDITALIDTLIKENDSSYAEKLLPVFSDTRNVSVREKILGYFTVIKNAGLSDYAVGVVSDPYDEKTTTVAAVFRYITELKITEAAAPVVALLESDNEEYYDQAITALGKIGGSDEAVFLAGFLEKEDLSVPRKQALMRALGELQAVETWETLSEIARDTDENTFVRMYAAEAIGNMKKDASIPILTALFEETDPNLRTSAVKGIANFRTEEAQQIILEAFKDNYYKVRLEAAAAVKAQHMTAAVPYLIFRAKNDPENVVKYTCYETLAALNSPEGNEFLVSVVQDKTKNETARAKAAAAIVGNLIEVGIEPVCTLARDTLKDDKLKNLRYALGKEFAKKPDSRFEDICREYLAHKDVLTKGTGLDIYAENRFSSLKETVKAIAADEKDKQNSRKARLILEKTASPAETD